MREEIEAAGGLKLIYIDPPFAVGADFGFNIEIAGETAEKKQSVIDWIDYWAIDFNYRPDDDEDDDW